MNGMISLRTAALATTLLAGGTALAAPLALMPGSSGTVPLYDGRSPTTTTLIDAMSCIFGSGCTDLGSSVTAGEGLAVLESGGGVIEAAGTTALNPYGSHDIALAFIFGGADSPLVTSATLSSFAGYGTSVEGCAPIFSSEFNGCTASTVLGPATRSSGTGDSVTFTQLAQISILGLPATAGYVVYTNAPVSALVDPPSNFTVVVDGETLSFPGFVLTPPSGGGGGTPTPEPATLALLSLGLAGLGLARRRKAD